jgi:hypothetical protein
MANIELDGPNKKIKVDSGDLTLDVPGDIVLDADGGDVVFADGGTNLLKVTNSSSDVVLQPQVDTKDIVFKQYDGTVVATVEDNATFNIPASKLAIGGTAVTSTAAELNILDGVTSTTAELNIMDGVTATTAELNILDGVTATAAEINLIDGGTARGTTAIADGDGVLINDAGTMRMTTVQTLKTYMGAELNTPVFKATLPNNANINNNSATVMALGTENLDTGGAYNTSTFKFTPTVEGDYFFTASCLIDFGNDAGEYGDISVQKNGNKVIASRRAVSGNPGISSVVSCNGMTHMNGSGDYVQAVIFHNYGSGRDMDSNEDYTFFHGFRLTGSR